MPGLYSSMSMPVQKVTVQRSIAMQSYQRVTPFADGRYGNELEGGRRDRFVSGFGMNESAPSIAQLPVRGASMHVKTDPSLHADAARKPGGYMNSDTASDRTGYQTIKRPCSKDLSGPDPYGAHLDSYASNWTNPATTQKTLLFGQLAVNGH